MDKIVKFIDCYIETETCNLKCPYCYIAQQKKFNNKLVEFQHTAEEIRTALSKKRLGGACLLNLCAGGETLLSSTLLPVVKALLQEGHYILLVTNGTVSQRFAEMSKWPSELLAHLFIKFSFHYLELQRLKILDTFIKNVKTAAMAGISYTIEVTANDELVPYIEEIKAVCMEHFGAYCHITIARDDTTGGIELLSKYTLEKFYEIWRTFDSKLLDYKYSIFKKKRNEFCYAGAWSWYLNLNSGIYRQCYAEKILGNIYDDTNKKLVEEPVGCHCSLAHCYNGHAFLTLGNIPGLDTATLSEMRNRMLQDGKEFLSPSMKEAMSCKLYETNHQLTDMQKSELELKYYKDKCSQLQEENDDWKRRYTELEYWHQKLSYDYAGLEKGHAELEYWHNQLKAQLSGES